MLILIFSFPAYHLLFSCWTLEGVFQCTLSRITHEELIHTKLLKSLVVSWFGIKSDVYVLKRCLYFGLLLFLWWESIAVKILRFMMATFKINKYTVQYRTTCYYSCQLSSVWGFCIIFFKSTWLLHWHI